MASKSHEKLIFHPQNISNLASEFSNEKIGHTLPISVKKKTVEKIEHLKTKNKVKRRNNLWGDFAEIFFSKIPEVISLI